MAENPLATQEKWDALYRDSGTPPDVAAALAHPGAHRTGASCPAQVLLENAHLLPASGKALDFACGLGTNALFLAAQGLETHAWDISPVAVSKLTELAQQLVMPRGLSLHAEARDLVAQPPLPASFDVIVSCHFLERPLNPHLMAALRPGGLLFYQTFTLERIDDSGPKNAEYRLAVNELLALFPGMRVLVYREEGLVGDVQRGFRNKAMLVAQKVG